LGGLILTASENHATSVYYPHQAASGPDHRADPPVGRCGCHQTGSILLCLRTSSARWLARARGRFRALDRGMERPCRTHLSLLLVPTVIRAQLSVPAGGISFGRPRCRSLRNISTTEGSLDIASRVVSAGECARLVVATAFVHGRPLPGRELLQAGECARPFTCAGVAPPCPSTSLPPAPLSLRPSLPIHLASSSRPPDLCAVHPPSAVVRANHLFRVVDGRRRCSMAAFYREFG
jgi:hypothetical protein